MSLADEDEGDFGGFGAEPAHGGKVDVVRPLFCLSETSASLRVRGRPCLDVRLTYRGHLKLISGGYVSSVQGRIGLYIQAMTGL